MRRLTLCLLPALTHTTEASPQTKSRPLVFREVTVVDASETAPRSGYTVVIAAGRIAAVGPTALIGSPRGSHVVEAPGKVLIPGLWDMHLHTAANALRRPVGRKPRIDENASYVFPLLVANGVTGIRDMSGDLAVLIQWHQEIADGSRLGPRMVVTGRKLVGNKPVVPGAPYPVRTAADVRESVRLLREQGADFVKIDLVPPRLYPAVANAASAEGLPFVGHVHPRESVVEASDLGQRSVEHLHGLLVASSPEAVELASAAFDEADAEPPSGLWTMGAVVYATTITTYYRTAKWWRQTRSRLGLLDVRAEEERRLRRMLDTQSDSLAEVAFARFIRNDTWQVPTLSLLRDLEGLIVRDSIRAETWPYIPPSLLERLHRRPDDAVDPELSQQRYARQLALVGAMGRAGVPLLAGTDAIGLRRLPGFSLADELALLVEAGLTPKQALRAATMGPAQFLGMQDSLGTIEVGKVADLVLLDANPLDDIQNVRRIRGVVLAGRYLPRSELDGMLKGVRDLVDAWREHSTALPDSLDE